MRRLREFPFEKSRRIRAREIEENRAAIAAKLGTNRPFRGRPPKSPKEKYQAVAIRLHPKVLEWARVEAKKRGLGYQTLINQMLLKLAA